MLFEKDQNEQKLWNESFDGNLIEVKRLISNGGWMDVDCKGVDRQTSTPLYLAAYGGHNDVVQVLLDAGADPNQTDRWGRTPLHYAAAEGHKEVVELLRHHTNPSHKMEMP